jgi:uncharacterized membrane protein YccC
MRDLVALWTSMPQDLRDLIITLLGTLAGVLVAFWLDRLWERRQSKQRYRQHLDACRYDLGQCSGDLQADRNTSHRRWHKYPVN